MVWTRPNYPKRFLKNNFSTSKRGVSQRLTPSWFSETGTQPWDSERAVTASGLQAVSPADPKGTELQCHRDWTHAGEASPLCDVAEKEMVAGLKPPVFLPGAGGSFAGGWWGDRRADTRREGFWHVPG